MTPPAPDPGTKPPGRRPDPPGVTRRGVVRCAAWRLWCGAVWCGVVWRGGGVSRVTRVCSTCGTLVRVRKSCFRVGLGVRPGSALSVREPWPNPPCHGQEQFTRHTKTYRVLSLSGAVMWRCFEHVRPPVMTLIHRPYQKRAPRKHLGNEVPACSLL